MKINKQQILKSLDEFFLWIYAPIMTIIMLTICIDFIQDEKIKNTFKIIIGYVFLLYAILLIITVIIKKNIKGLLLSSIILLCISLLLSFAGSLYSNFFLLISAIFLDTSILLHIFNNIRNTLSLSKIVSLSLNTFLFIFIGFYTIYLFTYNLDSKELFNALITIFSSFVGGSLTLGGVAWTIINSNKKLEEQNIQKAKPFIVFNSIKDEINNDEHVCCVNSTESNKFNVFICQIENSPLSIVKLYRVFMDNRWTLLNNNTTILPSSKCVIRIPFKTNNHFMILETQDIYGNSYYYRMDIKEIKMTKNASFLYTIQNVSAIPENEVQILTK